ncbi:arf-GAP with coiled-coil, ANK repeat and PH domain-containing protein 2-like [Ornithodoros turicata]|uniref:arf-GAP with coiled-coil, ANK repeat and PH domain-containing protein 2-like n=1 Tax=Ornithodoros turicata TaxID=34597 RepID=UPI0031393023
MKPIIELDECIRDSPKFREVLEENEESIDLLEAKLEKLVRLCSNMVETGKAHVSAKSAFINGIWDLLGYFKEDGSIVNSLNRFIQILTDVMKYQTILLDQAQRTIIKNLNNFVRNDIRQSKDTRRHFERISDDLDNALLRNSQVQRSKAVECEDAHNVLIATRSCFQHLALDYVHQLSCLQSKKRHEVLHTLLSLMHAYSTYFHQGSDLFQESESFLKNLGTNLEKLGKESVDLSKQLDSRHVLVTSKDVVPVMCKEPSSNNGIVLEGYLFKRTSNAFKTWNRRWFMIQSSQLVYRKRTGEEAKTVMEEDLRLCTVKHAHDIDRRFCFEVLSPSKSHMLQADSQDSYDCWITALQSSISHALNQQSHEEEDDKVSMSDKESSSEGSLSSVSRKSANPIPKPPRAHIQLVTIPGNELCCDCKSTEPKWASINLGVTLCIECSGIHRSLGVHVSKVRSLTLDSWEPEILKVMAELGNLVINKIYEAHVDESVAARATPDCSRAVREAWIKAKYVQKAFVKPLLGSSACLTPERVPHEIPRRWSVRKIHRRRRTMPPTTKAKPLAEEVAKPTRPASAALPPSSAENINTVSADPLRSEATSSIAPKGSDTELNAVSSPEEDSKTATLVQGGSDGLPQNVLVFGEALVQVPPPSSSLDIDSADESPTQDEEDTTPEEDISNLSPSLLLYRAAAAHNLPVMCLALANGADPNWTNPDEEGRYPLHQAIKSGSIMACEFLLLNGAKLDNADSKGRTSLHVSTLLGNTGQVCLLLKHGADQHSQDLDGATALQMAINNANPDIVTMLRLAKLNEEIRRDEFGNPGDDTFIDVVRDFSHMASNNPEKLRRQPSGLVE